MAIVGGSKKKVITNEDKQPINFDNNTVIDGYAGNQIERYVKYIDGKILELDYFSFIRGSNGENTLIDPADDTQQYLRVKQLQITLVSPITTTNYNDVTFDAVINAGIVPAENDLMVIQLLDGRLGMFKVSDITKRTYIAKKIYDIRGTFVFYSDANKEYFDSLYSKVKKTYIYDKSHITNNSAPIILEEKYKDKVKIADSFNGILNSYLNTFIHQKVLSVDYNNVYHFDYNIQKLVISLLDDNHIRLLKHIDSDYDARRSIVDDILDGRSTMSRLVNRYYTVAGVQYDISISATTALLSANIKNNTIVGTETGGNYFLDTALPVNRNIPNMFRASPNNLYLFSDSFYDNNVIDLDEDFSLLEVLLRKYLVNETVDIKDLETLINDMGEWQLIEQYHYTPFVLLLMRYSMLNTYSRI